MSEQEVRTAPEWLSIAICSTVLLVVLGLLGSELVGSDSPPTPTASVSGVRADGGSSFILVTVRNEGDEAAVDVQVSASLTIDGTPEEGDVVIGFLGGDEAEEVVFAFAGDPAEGELEVRVTSFAIP